MATSEAVTRATDILRQRDWDFKREDTRYLTHGLHPYPARMVPQIAKHLIAAFSKPGERVYDPMCGSGTVLVEARLAGRHSVGVDINRHALLLAHVKSTPIDAARLQRAYDSVAEDFLLSRPVRKNGALEEFLERNSFGIDVRFWFKEDVIRQLAVLRDALRAKIADEDLLEFFWVPFSLTVRAVSNTRPAEFKMYRKSAEALGKHEPDPIRLFLKLGADAILRMREFGKVASRDVESLTLRADARTTSLLGQADLIVTSPPYGDSHTTVAYGQYSRLSAEWLGFRDVRQVDRLSLGGTTARKENGIESRTLEETLKKLAMDPVRAQDVRCFFLDLDDALRMMSESLRLNGVACLVVGNRMVRGTPIPTDKIIAELAPATGLSHLMTYRREISSKNMPLENSPSNVAGERESTMRKESIVILQKLNGLARRKR